MAEESRQASMAERQGRILVVDDDRDLVESLVDILEYRGYEVASATSSQGALAELERFSPQVAVLDIRLGMDSGIDLLDELRRRRPALLCIMMTGYTSIDTAMEAIHKGAYDYLRKPVEMRYFFSILDRGFEKLRLEEETAHAHRAMALQNAELADLNDRLRREADRTAKALMDLTRSEDRLRRAQRVGRVGTWEFDTDSLVVWISPEAYALFGVDRQDAHMPLDALLDLFLPEDRIAAQQTLQELMAGGRSHDLEYRARRRSDGEVVWLNMRGELAEDPDGRPSKVLGTIQDVTTRRRAEEALRELNAALEGRVQSRTAELEAANVELRQAKEDADAAARAKSEFLANMSHEIRTPLNGVIGAAEQALREEMSPQAEHFLKIVLSSGYLLLDVINNILDLSKIEADKLVLEERPFRLDEVLDGVVDLFAKRVEDKSIELLLDLEPGTPMALVGDPLRLRQILTNLLDNAVKFTDKGGLILVRAGVTGAAGPGRAALEVAVRDSGLGMSASAVERLFEPFTQADSSTTRKYGGTGLGLSICQQLARMMGGRIDCESAPGQGSTFTLVLELERQSEEQEPSHELPADLQDLRILVVDDCADARHLICKVLESFGYRVEAAASGAEGLERVGAARRDGDPFDLLLVDWRMPELDGVETVRRLRERHDEDTPVIMVSAFGSRLEKESLRQHRIDGYLDKPFHASSLLNSILDVFGRADPGSVADTDEAAAREAFYRAQLAGRRVLLVEDNVTNRDIARAILEGAGARVRFANNGVEALEAVARELPEVVLMDVQMPEMDGLTATRTLRETHDGSVLPIVAMTAHALEGDRQRCLDAGMTGYLSKPLSQERLLSAVCEAVCRDPTRPDLELEAAPPVPRRRVTLPDYLPGLSVEEAREALRLGDEQLARILGRFGESNADFMDRLRAAYAQRDWSAVRQLAHGLKGSAGNVCANEVYEAALSLERASSSLAAGGRGEPPDPSLLERLEAGLRPLLEAIRALPEPASQPAPSAADALDVKPIRKVLDELTEALRALSPERVASALNGLERALGRGAVRAIRHEVHRYEYEEALAELRKLARSLGATGDA